MHLESNLSTRYPPRGDVREEKRPFRLLRTAGRWIPFVFPWSALRSMTGVVLTEAGVAAAHGRLDGYSFHVQDIMRRHGPDISGPLCELGRRYEGPVCINLPRSRTLVRHFRVPTDSEAEIEAMLPHLLAGELPQAIEHFSWAWSQLPDRDEGFALVTVYLTRNDQLEAYLAPVADAGLNVVSLIPEGWSRARAMGWVGSAGAAGDEPVIQSFVVPSEGAPYLVAIRAGHLLFDEILPAAAWGAPADNDENPTTRESSLDWDGPAFTGAREAFEALHGVPLPRPRLWRDACAESGDESLAETEFAAAVAATGLTSSQTLLPPARLRQSRRRTFLRAAAGLARLAAVAALIWLGLAVFEEGRTRQRLAHLEQRLAEQAPRVEILEEESAAIRADTRERAAGTEILQAVTSLRHHVRSPIYLEHLNYVQGRGIILRGAAPANADVLEMLEQLSTDHLWQHLRVTQLRSETVGGKDQVHFIVEERMD